MYAIRVEAARQVISITLTDRVQTAEALRAVSQLFTLAEASDIKSVLCDVGQVQRGPGGLLVAAAALSARFTPGMRMAVVGRGVQLRIARRFVRFSGVRSGIELFESMPEAEVWLATSARRTRGVSSTERRHAEELLRTGRPSRHSPSTTAEDNAASTVPAQAAS
jgi:hypothetical protein